MNKLVLSLCLLTYIYTYSQPEANNWYFGKNAGITFSTNPPTFIGGGQINSWEGCSSISDANGNLLFYSDGINVWDKNHSLMTNGYGLWSHVSTTQAALIIPMPGSNTLYYIFTPPYYYATTPLCYSVVDISLNGGMGDVTSKNIAMLDSSTEKVAAVRHANGMDIWVVGHTFGDSSFHAFLLTSSGLSPIPVISSTGSLHTNHHFSKAGQLKFSPAGNKLGVAVPRHSILELFDFDYSSGIVSNPVYLQPPILNNWANGYYGVEFSPDGSMLYASHLTPAHLLQYNVLAGSDSAIIASADTIAILISNGNSFGPLQTGPDGRIYLVKMQKNMLACIKNPNQPGSACDYDSSFVSLDTTIANLSLPGFLASYFNNLNVGVSQNIPKQDFVTISPNPNNGYFNINYLLPKNQKGKLEIFDVNGKAVYTQNLPQWSTLQNINCSFLSNGVYYAVLTSANERVSKKLVVIK